MASLNYFICPSLVSKHLFYPIWEIWDRSDKLAELRRLNASQWLSREEIEAEQWSRVGETVAYAYQHSPYYRHLLDGVGVKPSDIKSRADLPRIPVTKKTHIRNNLDAFISNEFQRGDLVMAKTGGSTGFSLDLYFDKRCEQRRNAAAIRSDQWAGWDMGKVRGDLWGNPHEAHTFKQKVRRDLLDRAICLDTMLLNRETMSAFLEQSKSVGVRVIFGHAHSIYIYAKFIEGAGLKSPTLDGVIATSMMLLDHERQVIQRVFGCRVTNRYGCEEVGLIACECESHQGMHINSEHVLVEFVTADGLPASAGTPAKILVTDLNNRGMPLLRYQVEDVGILSEESCACGRGLPIMKELVGRVADFLKTRSGDAVSGISLIELTLTKVPGVEQMQLVQENLDQLLVNRVKGVGYTRDTDLRLTEELQNVFGKDTAIVIAEVDEIPQLSNGKYRFSICNI